MDIEELTKSQIVLLVILISFITSMATGVVTVSLMDQAPTSVAQTVNRVIEQTIHEVASPAQPAAVATVTKTVVVKQSDEIASAVEQSSPSLVRLYSADGSAFLGLGVIVSSSGAILTDLAAVGESEGASVTLSDGSSVRATVATRDAGNGIALLTVATSSIATSTPPFMPVSLSSKAPVLGQTVILLSGQSSTSVGSGLISSIAGNGDSSQALVKTDISGDNVLYGSPLLDTNGSLIGLSTSVSRASAASAFEPIAAIKADLAGISSSK